MSPTQHLITIYKTTLYKKNNTYVPLIWLTLLMCLNTNMLQRCNKERERFPGIQGEFNEVKERSKPNLGPAQNVEEIKEDE